MEQLEKKYIFFLQLQSLDQCPEFFVLSKIFSEQGFQLIPVDAEELSILTQEESNFLLVLTLNLTAFRKFNLKRKKFINFALKNRKLTLFHLNSFGEIRDLTTSHIIKNYKSISPPIKYRKFAEMIEEYYYEKKSKKETWPGGRRARLPEIGNS